MRSDGNDGELVELAKHNALAIGAGHTFLIFLDDAFPVACLNAIKASPEVCTIHCATANPVQARNYANTWIETSHSDIFATVVDCDTFTCCRLLSALLQASSDPHDLWNLLWNGPLDAVQFSK